MTSGEAARRARTWMVEMAIPTGSTGTTVPRTSLAMSGVMKMHPMVVEVVITTESATSPLAMYVQRLDACPPLMEPTSTRPARRAFGSARALPMARARSGIIT